jgi:hypothetical protein
VQFYEQVPVGGKNISRVLWHVSIYSPAYVALTFNGSGDCSSSNNNNDVDGDQDNNLHIAFRCNFEDSVT